MELSGFLRHVRRGRPMPPGPGLGDIYQSCFETLLSVKPSLTVVIVGANDGRVNDPFYPVAQTHAARTRVMLVEPQVSLHQALGENYGFHPDHTIVNGAIGPAGRLKLYAIKSKFWPSLQPPYAHGWPPYRASTGVTSSDRKMLADWVAEHGHGLRPDDAIEELDVPCYPLVDALRANGFPAQVDAIQIDAEGADDIVLYNCSIAQTCPHLIHFESKSLSQDRQRNVETFLSEAGYVIRSAGGDTLAIRVGH